MNKEHASYHVRFYILATILGIGVHLALHELTHGNTSKDVDWLDWATFIFYSLSAVNFFHGKVIVGEDREFRRNLVTRPFIFLLEFFCISAVFVSLALCGTFLLEPRHFIACNFFVRLFDLILVNIALFVDPTEATRKAQRWWHQINVIGLVLFSGLLFLPHFDLIQSAFGSISEKTVMQWCFITYVAVDVFVDYAVNLGFFSPKPQGWNEIAPFWDAVQGEDGDIYRRLLIVPAIRQSLKSAKGSIKTLRILDLGCGNGCITRRLTDLAAIVIGVDKEKDMIDCAQNYVTQEKQLTDRGQVANFRREKLEFLHVDIEKGVPIVDGQFDVIIACFSLQDAADLDGPLRTIKRNLRSDGSALVVFENDNQFAYSKEELDFPRWQRLLREFPRIPNRIINGICANFSDSLDTAPKHRTTSRKWVSPVVRGEMGHGRKAIIFWGLSFARKSQIDRRDRIGDVEDIFDGGAEFVTITRHWTKEDYISRAKKIDLVEVTKLGADPIELSADYVLDKTKPEYELLLDYLVKPRFSMLVLQHKPVGT